MIKTNFSLRSRIFISMIVLVLLASVLIAGITIYQYSEQAKDYHADRLERKEEQLKRSLWYTLQESPLVQSKANVSPIFSESLYAISDVQNVNFSLYAIDGTFIQTANPSAGPVEAAGTLANEILEKLAQNKRWVVTKSEGNVTFLAAYSYVYDLDQRPLAILYLPYYEDNSFNQKELEEFLVRLSGVYLLMLAVAIVLAYLISTYITRSLKTISDKLAQTGLERQNIKIEVPQSSEEIGRIIESYNGMIDQLEQSAVALAKSEREQAWQEMAKQVAHEIKNPLTPMRLNVQSFQKNNGLNSDEEKLKLNDFCETLIEQIDTMSNVATSFSDFATLPKTQLEKTDIVEATKKVVEIFEHNNITLETSSDNIFIKLDKAQWIRVMTNLIKNSIQAIPHNRESNIEVKIKETAKTIKIIVSDNGLGVSKSNREKIFEPKFITKSDGMGLGLGIVKSIISSHRGKISYKSKNNKGTVFTISLPK